MTSRRPSLFAIALSALVVGVCLARPATAAAPLLVITDDQSANPFGAYWSEILRGEGLNAFATSYIPGSNLAKVIASCR